MHTALLYMLLCTSCPQGVTPPHFIGQLPQNQTSVVEIQPHKNNNLSLSKYQHQQGFFCHFEDRISKGKPLRFNLGLSEQ